MARSSYLRFLVIASAIYVCAHAAPLCADYIVTGDVIPDDPSKWGDSTSVFIAWTYDGSVTIDSNYDVLTQYAYVGYLPRHTGTFTVDGPGSTWTNKARLYIGLVGNGILNITGGGAVINYDYGYLGDYGSATGTARIDGTNSHWTNNNELYVGFYGKGRLEITGGGEVSNTFGYIGYDVNIYDQPPSVGTGMITVDGVNSKWTNSSSLYVGDYGKGTLNISGGASVTATSASVNSQSLLVIDVGNSSQLSIDGGSGAITNNGTIRILAGANAAGIAYTPISAAPTWNGSGAYQAIGGTWDSTAHTFSASGVQQGLLDNQITIDLRDTQRLLVTDVGLGASFAPATADTSLDFTASAISGQPLVDLQTILNANNQTLLDGWQMTVSGGYTTGQPAYLSFNVGSSFSRNDITVWYYDGTAWSQYDATDLTCNGGYASFTVYGFSDYALSVPEPGTLMILASGFLIMLVYIRRRFR